VAYYLSNSEAKALFAAPATAKEAASGADETDAQCWIVDDAELAKLTADLS
jgi:long-chain acyl-CoA synthetase